MSRRLRAFMLATDIGFLVYWIITALQVLPKELLYKDYNNDIAMAWNWSFVPLDLVISVTGLLAIYYFKRDNPQWLPLSIISLTLTFCSGLQAISFWVIRMDFDWMWWAPNLLLLVYPLFFLPGLVCRFTQSAAKIGGAA
ncbi:YvaD family protein [Paenibacillus soyae]|uniref:YvaD family protein n=1 Tax=Paenibacillus soyae TaxID=2969249 RepID=A0A9X2MPR2_9BACL|nr:YvaD family protein [Paenibacillus soyae]MCR2803987.1 YvaD family protein [Paenibacillus soyae]